MLGFHISQGTTASVDHRSPGTETPPLLLLVGHWELRTGWIQNWYAFFGLGCIDPKPNNSWLRGQAIQFCLLVTSFVCQFTFIVSIIQGLQSLVWLKWIQYDSSQQVVGCSIGHSIHNYNELSGESKELAHQILTQRVWMPFHHAEPSTGTLHSSCE